MGNLPRPRVRAQPNRLETLLIAQDLLTWTKRICLDDQLPTAEPKRLRHCTPPAGSSATAAAPDSASKSTGRRHQPRRRLHPIARDPALCRATPSHRAGDRRQQARPTTTLAAARKHDRLTTTTCPSLLLASLTTTAVATGLCNRPIRGAVTSALRRAASGPDPGHPARLHHRPVDRIAAGRLGCKRGPERGHLPSASEIAAAPLNRLPDRSALRLN
jgi:hypothetical protein